MGLLGVGGRGNGELLFNGYRVPVGEMKKFWRQVVMMVAQQRECI